MLSYLLIQNYALIEHLEMEAKKGFTIITGETGAGKSILLGALGLIAGQRADLQMLMDKNKKCIVEGHFDLSGYALENFFEQNELDFALKTIIRREITPNGKTRAFVNDTPVTLQLLKELSTQLIDIHSQHQSVNLNENDSQLEYLDAFSMQLLSVQTYKTDYKILKILKKQLIELFDNEQQLKKDFDYYQFQFDELEEAAILPGELNRCNDELTQLNHAEEIKLNLAKANTIIESGEVNLLQSLAEVKNVLSSISKYGNQYGELHHRVISCQLEIKDIAAELSYLLDNTLYNPTKIESLNERVSSIERLMRKHAVKSEEDLITIKNAFEQKIQSSESVGNEIEKVNEKIKAQEVLLGKLALKLRKVRTEKIPLFEKAITDIIVQLGMPKGQFKVSLLKEEIFNNYGLDKIEFLFSANKGFEPMPLSKVASGGELSRVMLAIKSIISSAKALPTIIFDEIDTGVSGEVAAKMGNIMKLMSGNIQVFSITHLPQIASKGDAHWFVYKNEKKNQTNSFIKVLTSEERITEIAKMLSSEKPTDAAYVNAKELLGVN